MTFFGGDGFDPSSHKKSFKIVIEMKVNPKISFITVILYQWCPRKYLQKTLPTACKSMDTYDVILEL